MLTKNMLLVIAMLLFGSISWAEENGSIEIEGVAGDSQPSRGVIHYCETDARGTILRYGCTSTEKHPGEFLNLNTEHAVKPGVYQVTYDFTVTYAQVEAGKKTVVSLKRIDLPNVYGGESVKVFHDYKATDAQEYLLKFIYVNEMERYLVLKFCSNPAPENLPACNAWASGDFRNLMDVYIKFDGKDTPTWNFERHNFYVSNFDVTKLYSNHAPGSFVSVFPGTYVIRSTLKDGSKRRYSSSVK